MTLEAAYSEAGPGIVGYLVATGTDEASARDLLHDAVARVAGRLGEYDPGALPAILFTTARNLRANRARHDAKIDFVGDARDGDGGQPSSVGPSASPSDAAYLRGLIAAAMRRLPDEQREAYVMYQVGERSVREIAEMTGASENLVKVRIHRAKASLRKSLADWKER